jgi:hypothetical protein
VELELPEDLERFRLPESLHDRLQELLDRQDRGELLTPAERSQAEGIVNLAEMLTLLRLRAERAPQQQTQP